MGTNRESKPASRDTTRWWKRLGSKDSGFRYTNAEGTRVPREALKRIASLVIPPAWREVRISPIPSSELQVIGLDALGRKQYLYHPEFRRKRESHKFGKLGYFGRYLGRVRASIKSHFQTRRFSKPHVLSVVVRLIHDLYLRVGTEKSVKLYKTFGVTTLRKDHIRIKRDPKSGKRYVEFQFVGKHHIEHVRSITSRPLVNDLVALSRLPGDHLFQYKSNDGNLHAVTPADVNDYIKSLSDSSFSAKDFRTWGATLLCAVALAELGLGRSVTESKKKVVSAIKHVATALGNTPAVCRKSYIHPVVIKAFEKGITLRNYLRGGKAKSKSEAEEAALLSLLASKHL